MGYCPRAGIFGTESAAKECDGNRKGKMMEERRKNTMILYRNLRYQQLFDDMCSLLKPEEGGQGESQVSLLKGSLNNCCVAVIIGALYGHALNLTHLA